MRWWFSGSARIAFAASADAGSSRHMAPIDGQTAPVSSSSSTAVTAGAGVLRDVAGRVPFVSQRTVTRWRSVMPATASWVRPRLSGVE